MHFVDQAAEDVGGIAVAVDVSANDEGSSAVKDRCDRAVVNNRGRHFRPVDVEMYRLRLRIKGGRDVRENAEREDIVIRLDVPRGGHAGDAHRWAIRNLNPIIQTVKTEG